ncbi:MAG: MFS transporter [Betaproteobacteria bacterium]|nr:MFS transporter [Betaproteobacteria bacterium]
MAVERRNAGFYGWRVVHAAFLLAVFGWGMGFYGPPVFLGVMGQSGSWSVALVSLAVSFHFVAGAVTGAKLPILHRRFGIAAVTKAGALSMSAGVLGWSVVESPRQLFLSALLSGVGWGTMSAAALNAIVSPWFVRARPAALGMAYNGGSVGGIVFSPLWVAAIGALGFPAAASVVAAIMLVTIWALADKVFCHTPETMRLKPDGIEPGDSIFSVTSPSARPLPGARLWRDRKFLSLAAGMSLGLFAQIGLTAHLFSLLVPALGPINAGSAMAAVTLMAIVGRSLLGWLMPLRADRRLVACSGYVLQIGGSVAFILAEGASVPLLLVGVVLFGMGFGNATSLPPLIAQVEFVKEDVPRVAALVVAIAQGGYAIAPAFFGIVRTYAAQTRTTAQGDAPLLFAIVMAVQCLAVCAFLAGRQTPPPTDRPGSAPEKQAHLTLSGINAAR